MPAGEMIRGDWDIATMGFLQRPVGEKIRDVREMTRGGQASTARE